MQRLAWRTTDNDDTLKFSREVCHNGRFFALLRTAITPRAPTVDPGNTGNLWRNAKFVGAGLLAKAVDQATSVLQQNRHSRASALLQLIRASPATFGERKVCKRRLAGETQSS
jgi:hypothetical protein